MEKINVLLLCGGGGSEHDISLISASHIYNGLTSDDRLQVFQVEIGKDGSRTDLQGNSCEMRKSGELYFPQTQQTYPIHFAIPCIHGPPGETGEIQGIFEQMELPYLGSRPEPSILCFNKVSTKLYFDSLGIPNTPYIYLWDSLEINRAQKALKQWGSIFVKASNQGSSIGCYKVEREEELEVAVNSAFELSPYVLIEKTLKGRELEVSAYEYRGNLVTTKPGEILCPDGFYTYEEKYDNQSHTSTDIVAKALSSEQVSEIQKMAAKAFRALKLRDLARIDFFLTDEGHLYLNEINTFPGLTPISMFPKMMESHGDCFKDFIMEKIEQRRRKDK